MRTVISRIDVYRSFCGNQFKVPVEVWNTPEGICARSLDSVFYRDENRVLMLLEVDEDPQLNEQELEMAEDALWVVNSFEPHVP